jgi:threonine synthase
VRDFMAAVMSHYLQKHQCVIRHLVATSGDTGGAVAQGFFQTPGISVTILISTVGKGVGIFKKSN